MWHWWKPGEPRAIALYLLLMGMALTLLLVALTSGGSVAAFAIIVLGALGLASLCLLVVLNLAVLPETVRTLRSAAHAR